MINVNDVVEVTYGCSLQDRQLGLNRVMYFCRAAAGGGLPDQEVADGISNIAGPLYRAYLCNTAKYLGLRLRKVGVVPAPAVSSTIQFGVGAIADSPLPPTVSMLFTKKTAAAGKVGRGRIYLPFWNENDNSAAAKPVAAALVLGEAVVNTILQPITVIVGASSVDMVPCLAKASTGYVPIEIIGHTQRTEWANQRRRSFINKGDGTFPPA